MTHYFFDIDDGATAIRDEIGLDFSSLQEVRSQAISTLPEIVMDELPDGDLRQFVVRVRDGTGGYLFEATISFQARWLEAQSG